MIFIFIIFIKIFIKWVENSLHKIFNRKIIDGFLNDLKIKDENQKFKVLRAIDKFDRIDENFIDLLQKERVDPVSGDKIAGANLSNDQATAVVDFLKLKDL